MLLALLISVPSIALVLVAYELANTGRFFMSAKQAGFSVALIVPVAALALSICSTGPTEATATLPIETSAQKADSQWVVEQARVQRRVDAIIRSQGLVVVDGVAKGSPSPKKTTSPAVTSITIVYHGN